MGEVWTPTPSAELEELLSAAMSRPGTSRVTPPRPVACSDGRTGWLWGRKRPINAGGMWLGLATLQAGPFDPPELTWRPSAELRPLG